MFAFWNGDIVPASEVRVSPWDAGFVTGTTVTEQMRTFSGRLFEPKRHFERLARGLEIVGIDCGYSVEQLEFLAGKVLDTTQADLEKRTGSKWLCSGHKALDVGIGVFVTPGPYAAIAAGDPSGPKVCIYAYPLTFDRWAKKYQTGESLALVDVEMPSPNCWPAELKCRSRMHYHLADREAESRVPGAKALLRSAVGYLRETAIANILLVEAGQKVRVMSPPRATILPGVSLAYVETLCVELGWEWSERELTVGDLQRADEVWLTSTPWCVLPVTRFQGEPIRNGTPGPLYQQLLALWSKNVGVDIPAQARHWAASGQPV